MLTGSQNLLRYGEGDGSSTSYIGRKWTSRVPTKSVKYPELNPVMAIEQGNRYGVQAWWFVAAEATGFSLWQSKIKSDDTILPATKQSHWNQGILQIFCNYLQLKRMGIDLLEQSQEVAVKEEKRTVKSDTPLCLMEAGLSQSDIPNDHDDAGFARNSVGLVRWYLDNHKELDNIRGFVNWKQIEEFLALYEMTLTLDALEEAVDRMRQAGKRRIVAQVDFENDDTRIIVLHPSSYVWAEWQEKVQTKKKGIFKWLTT